jgi:3-oxoacyl-[acyl-carrier protein] reductase
MDLGLDGKVALVTAASKGLGRACAEALAGEGAKVVICGRREDVVQAAAREMQRNGCEVVAVAADVTEPAAAPRLVSVALDNFGALDILVANAGGPPQARALELSDEQISVAINANLTTSVRLVREAVPQMRAGGWGRICCITSYSIKQPIPNLALSNLSRTGLWAWAKTAARDLEGTGITLNLACPGLHATDRMLELGASARRMGDPADFGRIVAFMCSQHASFVTGTAVVVDGGETVGLL